jgi:hypothetical protein
MLTALLPAAPAVWRTALMALRKTSFISRAAAFWYIVSASSRRPLIS